jgi:hypothetical protein
MYMRTVTEPRGTLPSVCAPAGLRRPCAHTSDSRIPIRHHLSNPQKSSIPLQTTPRRCIGTIDIVEPVFGGPGPATYRSTEAPSIGFRRGARDTYTEYESPTLHRKRAWCMHVTRGSTQHRYTEIPRTPYNQKPSFWTCLLERAARARSCRRAAEHRSGVAILEYKPAHHEQVTLPSVPRSKL